MTHHVFDHGGQVNMHLVETSLNQTHQFLTLSQGHLWCRTIGGERESQAYDPIHGPIKMSSSDLENNRTDHTHTHTGAMHWLGIESPTIGIEMGRDCFQRFKALIHWEANLLA